MTRTHSGVAMSKNTENMNPEGQLVYAVNLPYKGIGESKLILHEATLTDGGFAYGVGKTWIVDPSAVLRIEKDRHEVANESAEV